ncbi:MAG TPA: hypothetical protein VMX75_13750 [Spirochaetia bacterium]|nr:hypothetical protein [Spirochaetia bacterium]
MKTLLNLRKRGADKLRIILAVYCLGFLVGTVTHITDMAQNGFLGYRSCPLLINLFWTSLAILDPLAVALILLSPLTGIVLAVGIMLSDLAVNFSVGISEWVRTGHFTFWPLYFQAPFGIFVFTTAGYTARRAKKLIHCNSEQKRD